jgi:hypothetical protein
VRRRAVGGVIGLAGLRVALGEGAMNAPILF